MSYLSPAVVDENGVHSKAKQGLDYGNAILEKFIQIPFRLPGPDIGNYREFITSISAPAKPERTMSRAEKSDVGVKGPVDSGTVSVSVAKSAAPADEFPSTSSAETPRAEVSAPSPSHIRVRRQREIQFRGDSEKVRSLTLMFAATVAPNVRRVKQFVNLYRLQAFLANETGLFDEGEGAKSEAVTMEQLGKFVAISLNWPALLTDFAEEPELLKSLQLFANGLMKEISCPVIPRE